MDISIAKDRLNEAFIILRDKGAVSTQKDIADAMSTYPSNISRAFKGDKKYLTQAFLIRFNHAFGDIFNQSWLEGEEEFVKFRDSKDVEEMNCYYNESTRCFHANGDNWPSTEDGWYQICKSSFVKWDPFRSKIYDLVKDPNMEASSQMVKELWIDYNYSYNSGTDPEWQPPENILINFRKGIDAYQRGTIVIEKTDSDSDYVPLLPVEAMAGSLQGFSEGVALMDCRKIKSPVQGADWAIQISGDSMEPDYKNGTYLYIRKLSGGFVPWGQTIVVDTIDGVVVKDIFPIADTDAFIEARSKNSKYPPFKIDTSCILGMYRVLGGSFINSTI